MRVCLRGELAVIFLIGFSSWFFMISLEWYYGISEGGAVGDSWKTATEPYPGDNAQNLLWFLQVVTLVHSSASAVFELSVVVSV